MSVFTRLKNLIRGLLGSGQRPENDYEPLGVFRYRHKIALIARRADDDPHILRLLASRDGLAFIPSRKKATITLPGGALENIHTCEYFSVSGGDGSYIMTYVRTRGERRERVTATSENLLDWRGEGGDTTTTLPGTLVPNYLHHDHHVLFFGENDIRVGFSHLPARLRVTCLRASTHRQTRGQAQAGGRGVWHTSDHAVLAPRHNRFDTSLRPMGAARAEEGLFLIYDASTRTNSESVLQVGAALFDANDPSRVLWRTDEPLSKTPLDEGDAKPLGAVVTGSRIFLYWNTESAGLIAVAIPNTFVGIVGALREPVRVERHHRNPILAPREENGWEAMGTLNPGALHLDDKVHLVYRAVGYDGASRFGYAVSSDGIRIDERDDRPMYSARKAFEGAGQTGGGFSEYNPSGGGWGGCEDPKIVRIGDMIYLTYVAMSGTWPTHTALSSISVDDFRNKRWDRWSEPALMSPPEVDSKSACILPETINGQYVVFHRSWPDIIVEYLSDLNFTSDERWINPTPSIADWRFRNGKCVIQHGTYPHFVSEETEYTNDYDVQFSDRWKELTRNQKRITVRHNHWDSHKISLAAAPVKTEDGWLAIYGAVDKRDRSRYKIGAMLLDLEHPERVLHRTNEPIMSPAEWYEHDWKPNIIYPSGVVVMDTTLFIYYGGGDKYVCVATAPLNRFLYELKRGGKITTRTEMATVG
jgi:predicted GH43/DUF377 family glycosyl hydrolase